MANGMTRIRRWVALGALGLSCAGAVGCGGGLKVTRINSEEQKPNNVWVFFTVEKGKEPIGGLKADDFKIYEDDKLVSAYESKQVIQNPDVAAVMVTELLLDVSGSITESGKLDSLVDAAQLFAEKVGKRQKIGVYAFDGSKKIYEIVPFTDQPATVKSGLERMRKFKPKDPSTNLHGAVIQGMEALQKGLKREKKPLKFGTLVVFSDGADRAGRISRDKMNEELNKKEYKQYDRFAIGIGPEEELKNAKLEDIGKDGTEKGSDSSKVKQAFEKVAARIDAHTKRFYLLSYCTPSRSGKHEVRIEAHVKEPKASGSLKYQFDATGFGPPPDCDPEKAPSFRLDAVDPADEGGKKPANLSIKAEAK